MLNNQRVISDVVWRNLFFSLGKSETISSISIGYVHPFSTVKQCFFLVFLVQAFWDEATMGIFILNEPFTREPVAELK